MMVLVGAVYILYSNIKKVVPKYKWGTILLLMLPMAIDGTLQLVSELLRVNFLSQEYSESIAKRVITGALFGIGFALFVFSNLKEVTDFGYNDKENESDPNNNLSRRKDVLNKE